MDFPALLYTLQRRKLFFRAIKSSGTSDRPALNDPYDGHIPASVYGRYWMWEMGVPLDDERRNANGGAIIRRLDIRKVARKWTGVNCWHMNPVESAAMWSLYSPNYGIAIRSTIHRLIRSLSQSPTPIKIGAVQYINFDAPRKRKAVFGSSPVFVKRKSFEYEKELRAAILEPSVADNGGMDVEVDLSALIEKIFVSPALEGWVADVIREELKSHGVEVCVSHSGLRSKEIE